MHRSLPVLQAAKENYSGRAVERAVFQTDVCTQQPIAHMSSY